MSETAWEVCQHCYEALEKLGHPALRKYLYICEHDANEEVVLAQAGDHGKGPVLVSFLEQKGYVTTTEVSDELIMVLPKYEIVGSGSGPITYSYCSRLHRVAENKNAHQDESR